MQYMLMLYIEEDRWPKLSPAEQEQGMAAYRAYYQALSEAGVLVAADRLLPSADATRVRVEGGQTKVMDGPYAESKEQLGGFFMIDVADRETAISWAARCPATGHGVVEVRPVWAMQR